MKKMIMSLVVLISVFLLASCGASPSTPTVVPTHHTAATTTPGTSTTQPVPSDVQPTASATPPLVHLQVSTGAQLAHFYVTVTRAELHTVQTPPAGMTYLLVTATLRNTTAIDRPLLAANYILHDASGKAYYPHTYS